jgi:sucrose-6-phosphate hydrolase SacC (GH32 family)
MILGFAFGVCALAVLASGGRAFSDEDPNLPTYHYTPRPLNWMNDPNGVMFDPVHRRYHLFFQYM